MSTCSRRAGVGVGWNLVEYDALEMSRHFRRRGKRQEQQIALIRELWEQPVVDHEDSDHRIDRASRPGFSGHANLCCAFSQTRALSRFV
jgi:alkanesulfonate monooxygenase SsuD/methylene tetrahydromethanopterin reductase-like flavin-dependent oxidoreductase (luciferase family)